MSKTKKEKWIEVVTKRDGRSYTTAIRCSDITAIQKSVGDTVVDIHVSSDTIFTTVVAPTETNEIWNKVTGEEEE
tara:strand:+ start:151 stop:375 length:225 start_codon:yes stop_codon:yes gene_type:complete